MEYDEIDFRPYIVAVIRRWYWIIASALLIAGATGGLLTLVPKTYAATAAVVIQIQQTGSQLGVNNALLNIETIDAGARRQGLVSLATSEVIESRIDPATLARLAPANYKPGMIVRRNLVQVQADGDLLNIRASAPSPQQAKELVDLWATTYVDYAKTLYTDQHSQVQLASAALIPFEPSGPPIIRYAVLAGILGGLLTIGGIILRELVGTKFVLPRRRYRPEQHSNYPAPSSS